MILESYAEVYSDQFTTRNSPSQLVQCMRSTVPNNKKTTNNYVNQHDTLPSITINSSRARQLLCRVNVTGLRHQVKIKNIYLSLQNN